MFAFEKVDKEPEGSTFFNETEDFIRIIQSFHRR